MAFFLFFNIFIENFFFNFHLNSLFLKNYFFKNLFTSTMSKTAILEIEGKKYEFPIYVGTENEMAIDISKLRDLTGAVTIDQGYKNTGACKSEITFLDG